MKLTTLRIAGLAMTLFTTAAAFGSPPQEPSKSAAPQAATPSTAAPKFEAGVPQAPAKLPVLKLAPQSAPVELVNRLLETSQKGWKLGPLSTNPFFEKNRIKAPNQVLGVVEDEHIKAWVDTQTGDAAIYPTLDKLAPISPDSASEWMARVRETLGSKEFLAPDDTRFVIDKPELLSGATLIRRENGETHAEKPSAPYLAYFLARRFVGDFPVDGPGSRALLAVGNGGVMEGLTRSWKQAKTFQTVEASRNASQVREEIIRQLRPALATSDVTVLTIDIAFYDGNREFLQPVYRFTAQIHHRLKQEKSRVDDDFIIGYIPFAKALEPLPMLGESTGPKPTFSAPKPTTSATKAKPEANDPIVGRYVVRNDDSGWVNDANAFWSSVSSSWTGSLFTNSQYFWAEPRLFTNQKDFFINGMNLGLIEVHGDWWLYSTLKNCCDLVNINGDIPSPGYGPSANGRLADWIIHSCEVVPAPDDTSHWPDPWWTIFGGVRNVVGYRTIMYISDGAGGPYGSSLGRVAPVVSSWLGDVISLGAYSGHPKTAAHGGIVRPMGRPSTISMCGHDGDSVFATSSLGRANCLTVWWFPD